MTSPAAVLQTLMQTAGISSLRALSRTAGVSRRQVEQLRQGQIAQMRVSVLSQLATALQISVGDLLTQFSPDLVGSDLAGPDLTADTQPVDSGGSASSHAQHNQTVEQLRQEYRRLQVQLEQQQEQLRQTFQQDSLQILEPWLTFYPVAAHKAQQDPSFAASQILPLISPVEKLISAWGVEMLAPVGAKLPYDPQQHLLVDGANPGDLVVVTHPGYRQGEKLLRRAKVKLV
jgi:DNA-binding Xre family transcriptional regulator/molecular chaperone GrpE (heat shock protein)